jgi:hypothetical protein
MDLPKCISLIDRQQLFFSSVDVFGDPYEGVLPRRNRQSRETDHSRGKGVFVSSWHLNEFEFAAMWAIYSRFNSGIAIESTYARLVKSLDQAKEPIYFGKVRYIDYSKGSSTANSFLQRFTHK